MGDDVKFTVIATGFKQQEMPQRRERMLAEATLPTMRYDVPGLNVPIRPRADAVRPTETAKPIEAVKPAEPVAATQPEAAPEVVTAPVVETVTPAQPPAPTVVAPAPAPIRAAEPELVPVRASVFDDDFFKAPVPRFADPGGIRAEQATPTEARFEVPRHYSGVSDVQSEETRTVAQSAAAVPTPTGSAEPLTRAGTFAGAVSVETERAEPDELDIPAFLRRSSV
jgi:cell division protein FtsZ